MLKPVKRLESARPNYMLELEAAASLEQKSEKLFAT